MALAKGLGQGLGQGMKNGLSGARLRFQGLANGSGRCSLNLGFCFFALGYQVLRA